jgi:hypothetical protein
LIEGRVVKTANYNIAASDLIVEGDCTSGAITATLPTAVGVAGQKYIVKRYDVTATSGISNILTLATTGGQTVDGCTNWQLFRHGDWVIVYSDGTNWKVHAFPPFDMDTYMARGATLNRWYTTPMTNTSALGTASVVANTLYVMPFPLTRVTTFTKIQINVTTGGAGSSARIGIYYDNGNQYPGALVTGSDVGALTTTITGVQTNTFVSAITLQPGLYWLAFVCNATAPVIIGFTLGNTPAILGIDSGLGTAPGLGWSVAFTFAALPTPFTAAGAVITAVPLPLVALLPTA